MEIVTESDGDRLRGIRVRLASRVEEYVYGSVDDPWGKKKQKKTSKNFHLHTHRFDFSRKVDILGLWGLVTPDPTNSDVELIHSLSFITNECPGRKMLQVEKNSAKE